MNTEIQNKIAAAEDLIEQLKQARKKSGHREVFEEYGLAIAECQAEIEELQKQLVS